MWLRVRAFIVWDCFKTGCSIRQTSEEQSFISRRISNSVTRYSPLKAIYEIVTYSWCSGRNSRKGEWPTFWQLSVGNICTVQVKSFLWQHSFLPALNLPTRATNPSEYRLFLLPCGMPPRIIKQTYLLSKLVFVSSFVVIFLFPISVGQI